MNKTTQQERLLKELYRGKVNSYSATYSMQIKQAPTRIRELREKGYNITSITKPDRSVDWVLNGIPKEEVKKEQKWVFVGNMAVRLEEYQAQQNLI
jgi:hypothetical protein